jgi:hypothetical protein
MGKTYLQGEVLTAADLNASLSEAVNTTGYFVFTGTHVHNANLITNSNFIANNLSFFYSTTQFTGNTLFSSNVQINANVTLGSSAALVSSNTISDSIGNVRRIPISPVINGYTASAGDLGKLLSLAGSINIPGSVFVSGDNINILNNTASTQSVFPTSGLTLRQAGSTGTGNRTLDPYGVCTIIFLDPLTAVITGTGVN